MYLYNYISIQTEININFEYFSSCKKQKSGISHTDFKIRLL